MPRLALGIEYDGSLYHGWQRQKKNIISVQYLLEQSLSEIANEPINIRCAGRTDSGVHAIEQVIDFKVKKNRSKTAWTIGVNSKLPKDISVKWMVEVPDEFNSRLSAISRRYIYIIYNNNVRSALIRNRVSHYSKFINVKSMHRAAQYLIGLQDFSSFRSSHCQSKSPFRNMYYFNIKKYENYIIFDIKANSFVQHMIRNIIGSLLEIGYGNCSENWIKILLKSKDRSKAARIAKSSGLYLASVEYPLYFSIPKTALSLFFI